MRIENKSSSYPEIETRKRELCASYNQLPNIVPRRRTSHLKDDKTQNLNN